VILAMATAASGSGCLALPIAEAGKGPITLVDAQTREPLEQCLLVTVEKDQLGSGPCLPIVGGGLIDSHTALRAKLDRISPGHVIDQPQQCAY
jgi:hypothetical protein